MTKYLYHGSATSGITQLNASSKLHHIKYIKAVYFTESLPYALFYIWDSKHNKKQGKHVTAWIKDGIVYYEEQFPNQLAAFYNGVSGYIYSVEQNESFFNVANRESMWYSTADTVVAETKFIPNVYDEILKYAGVGKIKIIPFEQVSKDRIKSLYDHISDRIITEGLLDNPEHENTVFYKTYFRSAWDMAVNKYKS